MKKRILFLLAILVFPLVQVPTPAHADIPFDKNLLIQDSLFTAANSMSVSQIQDFLDDNGSLLANWVDNVDMRRPSDNCVVHKATGMTAAEIIHQAASAWSAQIVENCAGSDVSYWGDSDYSNYTLETVSPKVLLVLLQKEQSLISANGGYSTNPDSYKNPSCCSSNEYKLARATGYGVPDSGSINEQYLGFYNQINWASWQLRYNFERSAGNTAWDEVGYKTYTGPFIEGNWKRCATCPTLAFDGYYPIDGQSLYMENRATASLYYYTPHTYPGFFGNYNFVQFYNNWFGSPYTTVNYAFDLQNIQVFTDPARTIPFSKSTASLQAGETAYYRVTVKNIGSQPWDSNVRLTTASPSLGANSTFSDSSWLYGGRVSEMEQTTVPYLSNATFEFSMTAPSTVGTFTEKFALVYEGKSWMTTESISIKIDITNIASPVPARDELLSGQTLYPFENLVSEDKHSTLVFGNSGNIALFNDFTRAWDAGVSNPDRQRLVMQGDGNLVLYDDSGAYWNSGTAGNPGAYLKLINGNLVVYSAANAVLWQTNTTVTPTYLEQAIYEMDSGDELFMGQRLITADNKYQLVYQSDGNLVIYGPSGALWASHKYSATPYRIAMNPNGDLVAYRKDGTSYWSSGSPGNNGATLRLKDGDLAILAPNGGVRWNTGTYQAPSSGSSGGSGSSSSNGAKGLQGGQQIKPGERLRNGPYSLVLQGDGNLVLYGPSGALWANYKFTSQPSKLVMQGDGNLVLYGANGAYWSTKTNGNGNSTLNLQPDGNLVIYTAGGKAVWNTGTNQ